MSWGKHISTCLLAVLLLNVQAQELQMVAQPYASGFPLIAQGKKISLLTDSRDAKVVSIAADAFAADYALVSGNKLQHIEQAADWKGNRIVAGTVGQSSCIDTLVKLGLISTQQLKGQLERFSINVIENPFFKSARLLVVAGSDRRGTAYGLFHLSRMMGVSPFVWWADVLPEKKKSLWVKGGYQSPGPSVQFRGIFINDEDWGLQPWAARHMDTLIKDIGPHTYAKVFELMLRLKANYIWPAMHPCTKAFYYYKDNPKVADDYAIIVGGSHCEPMLRNNVFEWAENYPEEYGKKPGEWRYDLNKEQIYTYWDDRVKESVSYESVYTIGMRGVHDGSMPGPKDPDAKLSLLQEVISDQRKILHDRFGKSASEVPQIFVPYKEVLSLYRRGLKLDDDITIIWPDDNHGYIRQFPNEKEQQRSGGHGVYYHLSYWGSPYDYLWLSSVSPSLIAFEMNKAWKTGARRLWVFNVGDIKPAEAEIQFAMDMAWDINTGSPANAFLYPTQWAKEIFGESFAKPVQQIKQVYYELAAAAKPEHLGMVLFTQQEWTNRLKKYDSLVQEVNRLTKRIPARLQDAWYQLIEYPVRGAALMNNKIASLRMGDTAAAIRYWQQIKELTFKYNHTISKGKWNGMMDDAPRQQAVFNKPVHPDSLKLIRDTLAGIHPLLSIQATDWQLKQSPKNALLTRYPGLGIHDGVGLTVTNPGETDFSDGYAIYHTALAPGKYKLRIKCLPAFALTKGQLRFSLQINNGPVTTHNVHIEAETARWKQNVVNGFSWAEIPVEISGNEGCSIKINWLDEGLIINTLEFFAADSPK